MTRHYRRGTLPRNVIVLTSNVTRLQYDAVTALKHHNYIYAGCGAVLRTHAADVLSRASGKKGWKTWTGRAIYWGSMEVVSLINGISRRGKGEGRPWLLPQQTEKLMDLIMEARETRVAWRGVALRCVASRCCCSCQMPRCLAASLETRGIRTCAARKESTSAACVRRSQS